ncbi:MULTISPECIES: hypothetical protein [unclassified Endozoicomonas]
MRDEILERIKDHNVIIHYAIESGSCAWGVAKRKPFRLCWD